LYLEICQTIFLSFKIEKPPRIRVSKGLNCMSELEKSIIA